MRRHRFRNAGILLCILFFTIIGVRLLPLTRPVLYSSLRTLALISVCSSHPDSTFLLWKEKILSDSLSDNMIIPIVDDFSDLSASLVIHDTTEEDLAPEPSPVIDEADTLLIPIPTKYQAPIIEETMSGQAKPGFPTYGSALIKNSTNLSDEELSAIASEEHKLSLDSSAPQVLIYHTHATESFEPYDSDVYDTRSTWRSTDSDKNMIAVGAAIAEAIEAHGIQVIHDHTLHDYPSYNGSYERSAVTVEQYLEQYPSICIAFDVHRDAIQREDTLVKPVTTINGEKVAQLMLVAGCDDSGSLGIPTWQDNLRFGVRLQDQIEQLYPGLCRPLYCTYRKYNQHLTNASLLLEVGSHGNTLEEAIRCGTLVGDAIGTYLAAQL